MGRLAGFGRGGDALERGDPEADARVRTPDFGACLRAAAGEIFRRFKAGAASPSVGDSSVKDSWEDMGDLARFSDASLRGVCSREVAWREVSAIGESTEAADRLGEGEGDLGGGGGGARVGLTFGRCRGGFGLIVTSLTRLRLVLRWSRRGEETSTGDGSFGSLGLFMAFQAADCPRGEGDC